MTGFQRGLSGCASASSSDVWYAKMKPWHISWSACQRRSASRAEVSTFSTYCLMSCRRSAPSAESRNSTARDAVGVEDPCAPGASRRMLASRAAGDRSRRASAAGATIPTPSSASAADRDVPACWVRNPNMIYEPPASDDECGDGERVRRVAAPGFRGGRLFIAEFSGGAKRSRRLQSRLHPARAQCPTPPRSPVAHSQEISFPARPRSRWPLHGSRPPSPFVACREHSPRAAAPHSRHRPRYQARSVPK